MAEAILRKIYYDPETGFSSKTNLLKRAKLVDPTITAKDVQYFMDNHKTAQIHTPVRKKRTTPGFIAADNINDIWYADLIDMQTYPSNKYIYILIAVDIFSRKAYTEPMQSRQADVTAAAMMKIFDRAHIVPARLKTDNGTEFTGSEFHDPIGALTSHTFTHIGDHRANGVIDNTIKQIKGLLFRYMTEKDGLESEERSTTAAYKAAIKDRNYSWLGVLQKFTDNYNSSAKKPLLDNAPNEVEHSDLIKAQMTLFNQGKALLNIINQPVAESPAPEKVEESPENDYKVGDKIRVLAQDTQRNRSFKPQFSKEIYTVKKVNPKSVIVDVKGVDKRYVLTEVRKVGVALDSETFEIEKVNTDKTRTISRGEQKNIKQVWVKYAGYPKWEWVDESDIQT